MSAGIRVDSRELEHALDELAADVSTMPETWTAVGEAILPAVRERTPVRSGRLRDSWRAEGQADRASITSDEPYAGVVEAINAPIAGALEASERTITAELEEAIARQAEAIGFRVKR